MSRLSRRVRAASRQRGYSAGLTVYRPRMMLARANACVLPRYLVLPPPTAAAPCLVQTFFAPVEMPAPAPFFVPVEVPAPAPAPATDERHALREFFTFVFCILILVAFAVLFWG